MSNQTVVTIPNSQLTTTCGDSVSPASHTMSFNPSLIDGTSSSSSLNFMENGLSVDTYGYTTGTSGTTLYFVNDSTYSGLGIDNGVSHYISSDTFIQFDFCELASKFVPGTIPTFEVQSKSGSYSVYGSNVKGTLGTLLVTGVTATQTTPWPITVSGVTQTFPVPSFEDKPYQYISITGDELVVSFLNFTSFDDTQGISQVVCCPPPCPPECPEQPELPPLEPTYVEVGMEIAPVVNLTVNKPKICLTNYAAGVPKKKCCVVIKKKCCDKC